MFLSVWRKHKLKCSQKKFFNAFTHVRNLSNQKWPAFSPCSLFPICESLHVQWATPVKYVLQIYFTTRIVKCSKQIQKTIQEGSLYLRSTIIKLNNNLQIVKKRIHELAHATNTKYPVKTVYVAFLGYSNQNSKFNPIFTANVSCVVRCSLDHVLSEMSNIHIFTHDPLWVVTHTACFRTVSQNRGVIFFLCKLIPVLR